MITKRNTLAAVGGLAAAVALLTGQASADELAANSALIANSQALQARLDQLAQAPPQVGPTFASPAGMGGTAVPAGTGTTAGSFPRSFLIPGTDTSLRIGGQITEVVDYWLTGGPPNGSPQSTTLGATGQLASAPLNNAAGSAGRQRGHGIFQQSPRESKIAFETRTPTAWGEARTLMEFDWAGSTSFAPGANGPTEISDSLVPRVRYVYGTLGGFLAGQANSNFADPDANGETLDFGGNVGEPGRVRVPQLRYTMPVAWGAGGAVSMSMETPETTIFTTGQGGIIASDSGSSALTPVVSSTSVCTTTGATTTTLTTTCTIGGTVPFTNPTKANAPDVTLAYYVPQPWGHFDMALVVRPGLEVNDGLFVRRDFMGYGGQVGFDVKPGWMGWAKDDIIFHAVAGDGMGSYLNETTNTSLDSNYGTTAPATRAAAAAIRIKTVGLWGGEVGYQHWWADNVRSNINGGINHQDFDAFLGATARTNANKELITAHANLIWSPVAFVDMGVEFMFGHRQTATNLKGDEGVILSKFAFKF